MPLISALFTSVTSRCARFFYGWCLGMTTAAICLVSSVAPVAATGGGSLYLTPNSARLLVGQTYAIQVRENSSTVSVNHVKTSLSYASSLLDLKAVSISGSPFNVVLDDTGGSGLISLDSETDNATLSGDQLVATIDFEALTSGQVSVIFSQSSAVMATSDNLNQLGQLNDGIYALSAPAASPAPPSATSTVPKPPVHVTPAPAQSSPSTPSATSPATAPANVSPTPSPSVVTTQAPPSPAEKAKPHKVAAVKQPSRKLPIYSKPVSSSHKIVKIILISLLGLGFLILLVLIFRRLRYRRVLRSKSAAPATYTPPPPAGPPYPANPVSEMPSPYPSSQPYAYSLPPPVLADGTPLNPMSATLGALVMAPHASSELEETINRTFYPLRTSGVADDAYTPHRNEPPDMFEMAKQYPASYGNDLYIPPPAQPLPGPPPETHPGNHK